MKIVPDAALAQHIAVLGKTGAGKSYAVKGIVEHLLAVGRRVGIVDPTGAWWGLRSSSDGRGPGFPILVLGGDHGDLPLPALGGAAVARLLVDQHVNLVADTSQLTVGERTRWFIEFATTLHRLNRSPLHLVMDEAHMFAPQGKVPDPDTGKMLHAANTLASGGRSRGIRLVMITQRPQKLHKDALTSADTLIAMRVLAPQDRLAVEDWIKGCGDMAAGKEVLNSLASLKRGEGWVWYPEGGHLARVKFPPITTFDSSATPTDGHAVATPRGAAEIDLSEIKSALADAVKEAEANDPKLLRKRIAELECDRGHPKMDREALSKAEERGYARGRAEGAAEALRPLAVPWSHMEKAMERMGLAIKERCEAAADSRLRLGLEAVPYAALRDKYAGVEYQSAKHPDQIHALPPGVKSDIDKPMPRAILTALAQHPGGLTKGRVLVHTGYRSSGPVSACFAELSRNGWIESDAIGSVRITDAGLKALGPFHPLPVGAELRAHLLNGSKLAPMEKKMLRAIFDAYPNAIGKGRVLEQTGYASSGPTSKAFAHLVALGYVTKDGRGALRASEVMFQ